IILALWSLATWRFGNYWVSSPWAVAISFVETIASGELLRHAGYTLTEAAAGTLIGGVPAVLLPLLLRRHPVMIAILDPFMIGGYGAPKLAFAPLFILWMGFTIYPKILVAILIVFFPVMVNVLTAIRTVDPDMVNLARAFSATRWQIFRMIELPATMPPLFAGLRIASTLAVIGVVVGELVGGNRGLGYLLAFGEGQANTPMVFVVIMMLTLVGGVAYLAVILIEMRVLHYMPARAHTGF
ncbi:MAG: ABC transporter permease, partial [Sphingomicrobium sp.]